MTAQSKAKLIIFDIDGTLADRDSDEILPGVRAFFDKHSHDFTFALATNQGGVGLRHWMEVEGFGDPSQYPTEAQAVEHICAVMDGLTPDGRNNGYITFYVCYAYQSKKSGKWGPSPYQLITPNEWNPDFRKPAPGMLLAAMADANASPAQTLMVGDSEEDEQAAKAAGCHFQYADDFFQR